MAPSKLEDFKNKLTSLAERYPWRIYTYSLALLIRFGLIYQAHCFGDSFDVKYTDVDYRVFTDGAKLLLKGESVYNRDTYRYTPLFAILLIPNLFLPCFGKILFSVFDLLTACVIERLIDTKSEFKRAFLTFAWLFNPIVICISTRGSAESVVCLVVVLTILALRNGAIGTAGVLFGLSVHIKLYPIIYGLPYLLSLYNFNQAPSKPQGTSLQERLKESFAFGLWLLKNINIRHLVFASAALVTFLLVSGTSAYFCGFKYVYEAFLYHYVRADHRHNFSVYFNYIHYLVDSGTKAFPIFTFLPQLVCTIAYGFLATYDLTLAMFLQTVAFVALNKVCTSQYFVWWLVLAPMVFGKLKFQDKHQRYMIWAASSVLISKGIWLLFAYMLEFLGCNTFLLLLFASAVFVFTQMLLGWIVLLNFVTSAYVPAATTNQITTHTSTTSTPLVLNTSSPGKKSGFFGRSKHQ